jgi:hypothetical protein
MRYFLGAKPILIIVPSKNPFGHLILDTKPTYSPIFSQTSKNIFLGTNGLIAFETFPKKMRSVLDACPVQGPNLAAID